MKMITSLFVCLSLLGCTYNVSMVHTSGTASDVIDETTANTPTVTTTIKPSGI
jgi:hypothetical protein